MSLHPSTVAIIKENKHKFSSTIQISLDTLFKLIKKYSALSDVNYLLQKSESNIDNIKLPQGEASWLPIRNLIRLIAKIAATDELENIAHIYVESMKNGCDYFDGNVFVTINGEEIGGPYKWQWTAFNDSTRNYDKFTIFPEFSNPIIVDQ